MNFTKTFATTIVCTVLLSLQSGTAQGGTAPEQSNKLKVFLLAGQSNMDGRGDGSRLSADDRMRLAKAQERVRFAYNHKDIAALSVTVPQAHIVKTFGLDVAFGPELFFGIEMAEAWPDSRILLIKRSLGGVSLYGCWNPDWSLEKATAMNEADRPKLYRDFSDYVQNILSTYHEDDYEISGMLWVQGETDSNVKKFGPEPAATYAFNLQNLIATIRKDTGVAELPFFMLQVGNGKVVDGMRETAETMENVYFIPQSRQPDSPAFLPKYGAPHGHYNYEGMKRIGTRFADAYLNTSNNLY